MQRVRRSAATIAIGLPLGLGLLLYPLNSSAAGSGDRGPPVAGDGGDDDRGEAPTRAPTAEPPQLGSATPEPPPAELDDLDEDDDFGALAAELDAELEESLDDEDSGSFPDPLEPVNRGIFHFNRVLNDYLLLPLADVYQFIVPSPGRRAIRHIFQNLNEPVVIVNDVLQLEWRDAGRATTRFVFNSSVGVAGMWDAADYCLGIEHHDSDFGQTLALAGAGSGPYLVIPVLGPATARDGSGSVVDAFMQPTTYLFGLGQLQVYYSGSQGFSTLADNADSMEALEESSIDFYAALRSAYSQQRRATIWDRRQDRRLESD